MEPWKDILGNSLTSLEELSRYITLDANTADLQKVVDRYPMRINPYYLNLIREAGDPILRQAVPHIDELLDTVCIEDPLAEENLSPVSNLVHKYPDRVLFLVTNQCAMYCRFCTRKRKVGKPCMAITPEAIQERIAYLEATPSVREVLISGGDPLLLDDDILDTLLHRISSVPHIEVIRIGSRVPCTLPMRITPNLVKVLKKYHPLYLNTHFNHPAELTAQAHKACEMLADAGIPLACQTVLLKNVNDDSKTLRQLFCGLLKMRVKPYYLFQGDLTMGTNHFRTHVSAGIDIMRDLIGHISGMAIPTFALDAPGGKGKIPLTPQYIIEHGKNITFNNYKSEKCYYPEIIDY